MTFRPVDDGFQEALAKGVFPGAVLLVGKGEEVVLERAFGFRSVVPEKSRMQVGTIFDLASLTKPLATASAIMLLVRERKIRLDDRVTRFFPNFGVFGKTHVTFRHLLAHCSGLPAWKPYYEEIVKGEKDGKINFIASRAAKSYIFQEIHREKPLSAAGQRSRYSDLGFMFLGEVVEEISGRTLDRYCQEKVFKPLGLRSTSFVDLTQLRTRRIQPIQEMIAPTEHCPWRKKILCGEVHDDNAYAMGGVVGHAGLFSSAGDIHGFLSRLKRCLRGGDPFLPESLLKEFLTRDKTVEGSTHALGWDTPSRENSSSGSYFSPNSVGHLGFTGTSIWWDLEKDCHIILLTNRIHPSRSNDKIKEFRPYIHDLIMKAVLQ
ncbi:MAG TPA: serine hydrolase domain-containing protein [Candidatus Binatia bacterium]|jgi:CubicO group peptidase (beta-lactamase class C family)|nr:serine hydrolase domain-containing protein [Candidatus Binatia bacterium]